MNEPSDPQRPSGGDLPQETAAFEDTEFSFGEPATFRSSSNDGFSVDATNGANDADDAAGSNRTEGFNVADASPGEDALGLAADPEMTGIIPTVREDSVRPEDAVVPTSLGTSTEASTEGGSHVLTEPGEGPDGTDGDADGADTADGNEGSTSSNDQGVPRRTGLAAIPPWTWILGIGAVLALLIGLFSASLMRSNDVSDSVPLTSLTPSYARPSAWNPSDAVSVTAPVPAAGYDSGYGYGSGYGDGYSDNTYDPYDDGTTETDGATSTGGGAAGTTDNSPGAGGTPDAGNTGGGTDNTGGAETGDTGDTTGNGPGTDTGDTRNTAPDAGDTD